MNKVKLGIIGAGNIARQHLSVIRDIEGMDAVGITSRTKVKAQDLAKEYNIPVCADDIDSLIKEAKPDALMVFVSPDQIYAVTASLMALGLPLFIEKPPGLAPDETRILAELAQKHSIQTMVGFNRRYYSIFHKGIDMIRKHGPLMGIMVEGHERMWLRADRLAKNIRSQWIFVNSTHTIDLLRFFGGEPINMKAIGHRYLEPRGDQFAAIMETESGAIGQYSAHWYSPGGWRVVLYGDGVTVEFKPLEDGRWMDRDFKLHKIEPDQVDIKYKPGFFKQMQAFRKLVAEGDLQWPMLDLEGAYKTMQLAEKMSSQLCDRAGVK